MENKQEHRGLYGKDRDYVWHSLRPYNPDHTMIIEKASGCRVIDHEGKHFLDAMSGLWCVNVGYGRTELAEAAYQELKELSYYPLTQSHKSAILLAEKLNTFLGDDYVIFFSNSGSEANETAFKIARQFHHENGEHSRFKIISRYRGYHGNTMAALAATGQAQRKYMYEPLTPGFIHVAPPDMYRNPEQSADPCELKSVKDIDMVMTWELSETIAAVIIEPIITGGGILMPPEGYLQGVQEICKKHGALLIIDEVICGFGRTGKAFGFMHEEIKPDIITMAKGITSAYLPLAATAVKKEIYDSFKGNGQYDYFRHINTFGGHPASCAVALKNLKIMERENLFERSAASGNYLRTELEQKLAGHPFVGDIRGRGLLLGIELVKNKESKEPQDAALLDQIIAGCKQKGLIIGKNGATVAGFNNVLTCAPPLNITKNELDFIIDTISEEIKKT